jgi:hypothetical protein
MFWVFIFLAVMVRTKGDTAADPVLLEALRYYKRDHGRHMPFSIFKRDHHAGQSRWIKLKKVVDKEEKLPAVNFELPASRIAEDDLVLPASRIGDDDLVSFIFEHLDMPDSDIQARWQLEPDRVQRCRQRALKRLCRDTDDVYVVRFIRGHEHWTRDQVCFLLVIDNERFDRCLARARLFPLSESSVREYPSESFLWGCRPSGSIFSVADRV